MNTIAQPLKPTILVVEDERLVAMDLKLMLEQLGYQVLGLAADGPTAIASAQQLQPQLILMDIHLQGAMDGIEVAAAIRLLSDVPIIFLTAHADPATRARVRALAPYGYLIKPFDDRLLEVTLEMALTRHAAEQRTRASEQWLMILLASLGDAVVATGTDSRIMMINPSAEQLIGLRAAGVMGRPISEVLELRHPETAAPLPYPSDAALASSGSHALPPGTLLHCPKGNSCRIDGSLALIRDAGRALGMVMVFRDNTPRRLAEQARSAEQQRHEAARQRERLKVLAGGIAHDLNNMLTSVIGSVQLAELELPSLHPANELLTQAEAGGQRAAELTRQLLVYAGRAQPQWAPLDFCALTAEALGLLRGGALKDQAIRLTQADQPLMVNADAAQLRQVVMNLLLNAVEAHEDNSGTIQIALARVDTASPLPPAQRPPAQRPPAGLPPGNYAVLTVTDTGRGMDSATLERIFEPFFTTKFTGRGLGLALVQGIIHEHGGAVGVQSAVGQGSAFTVWLPDLPIKPPEQRPLAAGCDWKGEGAILVIDDEEALRAITSRILQQLGFTVLVAPDGAAGLQLFRAEQQQIICVITDVTMPGISGTDVAREIRRLAPELPLILMSGYSEERSVINLALELQSGFLPKPFGMVGLRCILKRWLDKPSSTSA
jgi:two-component system cell cycle sensor histidine kinase/response regulator CckA